jgi:chromosome partitioning protein
MIWAFVGQKGGIGKSTLATCVAAELVSRHVSVLLVDADVQHTTQTWHDVASEKGHEAPSVVAMTDTLHAPHQLPKLSKPYEVTIIDTPARVANVMRSALMIADVAVLPCGPSYAEAWGLAATVETVQEARTLRKQLRACILINRKRTGTVLGKEVRATLEDTGLPVLMTEIGDREVFKNALGMGLGVTTYAPSDRGAAEVRALVDELLTFKSSKRKKGSA